MRLRFCAALVVVAWSCGETLPVTPDPTTDAAADAGSSPDAASAETNAPPACTARFCSDFDRDDAGTFHGWDGIRSEPDSERIAVFDVTSERAQSAPRSFRANTRDSGTTAQWLLKSVGDPTRVQMSFSVYSAESGWAPGDSVSAQLIGVRCGEATDALVVRIRASKFSAAPPGGVEIEARDQPEQKVTDLLPRDRWVAMRLVVEKAVADGGANGVLGRVSITTPDFATSEVVTAPAPCSPPVVIRLGAKSALGAGEYDLHYDDVAIDW